MGGPSRPRGHLVRIRGFPGPNPPSLSDALRPNRKRSRGRPDRRQSGPPAEQTPGGRVRDKRRMRARGDTRRNARGVVASAIGSRADRPIDHWSCGSAVPAREWLVATPARLVGRGPSIDDRAPRERDAERHALFELRADPRTALGSAGRVAARTGSACAEAASAWGPHAQVAGRAHGSSHGGRRPVSAVP